MTFLYLCLGYFFVGVLAGRAMARIMGASRTDEYVSCALWPLVLYGAIGALLFAIRNPEDPLFYADARDEEQVEWMALSAASVTDRWRFAFANAVVLAGVMWWPVVLPLSLLAFAYDLFAPAPKQNDPTS